METKKDKQIELTESDLEQTSGGFKGFIPPSKEWSDKIQEEARKFEELFGEELRNPK